MCAICGVGLRLETKKKKGELVAFESRLGYVHVFFFSLCFTEFNVFFKILKLNVTIKTTLNCFYLLFVSLCDLTL